MLVLDTQDDVRSFEGGSTQQFLVHSTSSSPQERVRAVVMLEDGSSIEAISIGKKSSNASSQTFEWNTPTVAVPTPAVLKVEATYANRTDCNEWPIWIVPAIEREFRRTWYRHPSMELHDVQRMIPKMASGEWEPKLNPFESGVIARLLDPELLNWIERGGLAIVFTDGSSGSFPVSNHWFLRGGVIVNRDFIDDDRFARMLSSLQTFDLAGPTMLQPDYLDEVTPFVLLWDNHDIKDFRFHALSWLAACGRGRLGVSTLRYDHRSGAAGKYVASWLAHSLENGAHLQSLSAEWLERVRSDLSTTLIPLPEEDWQFQPDPKSMGLQEGWQSPSFDRSSWSSIRIGSHWDGQGFGHVDGWAWYAKRLRLPKDARYLTFTGVDDYFDLFVDGIPCGAGGDRQARDSAFEKKITLALPDQCVGKESIEIVVAVEDWQGAGGIFRPVFVSNERPSSQPPILVRNRK